MGYRGIDCECTVAYLLSIDPGVSGFLHRRIIEFEMVLRARYNDHVDHMGSMCLAISDRCVGSPGTRNQDILAK